jgi:glycosyltransferase involved in cell wall biosynthesis
MSGSVVTMLVSVIIPVFNGERFVGRTLESVLGQTYQQIEVVVVDDGSTDQTPNILDAAAARNGRIRNFRTQNSGVAAARNFGILQARGELIAPLDADDLWHPEKLARQVEVMSNSSPRVGLVYCWSVDIDENDLIIPPIRAKCAAQGRVVEELASRNNFLENGSVPLIRRSDLDAVGGYDTASLCAGSEDWKLYFALAEICEFAVVPSHLVGYRRLRTGMSRKVDAMEKSIKYVEEWVSERCPSLSEKDRRQMYHHSNAYLAYLALSNSDFTDAVRYHLRSLKAEPAALLSVPNLIFCIRFLARQLGITRSTFPSLTPKISFKEFQPRSEAAATPILKSDGA